MSNNPKLGYKLSEIGEIPEEWEVVEFNKCFIRGKIEVGNISKQNYKEYGLYSIIDQGANFIAGYTDDESKVFQGDLPVIIFGDHTRFFKYVNFPFVTGADGTKILRPNRGLFDPKYLYYALLNLRIENLGYNRHFKLLKEKVLPLPPLPEQRKIASILSTVDEAIQKTDEVIEKTQKLRKGLMQRLLAKGIGHTRFKQTEIGEIPEEWEVMRLGDVLTHCEYGLSIKLSSSGKYPIFRMNNIENGYVVENDMKYVDLNDGTFNQFKLEKGDILFNRTNSYDLVGKVGIFLFGGGYTFASYLIRLRANQLRANPFFISSYLNADRTQFRLKNLATRGVSQSNINATNLKSLKAPCPPLPEQCKIAEILSGVDKKIEVERKRKEKLEKLKKGLMQDLLTGKIRVKLVGADPCVCPQ